MHSYCLLSSLAKWNDKKNIHGYSYKLRQEFLHAGEKIHPIKQPNQKKKKKRNLRSNKRSNNNNKKILRSTEVQDSEKKGNLCEEEREVGMIERKEAKGDKINCNYLVESRHLTALSDS